MNTKSVFLKKISANTVLVIIIFFYIVITSGNAGRAIGVDGIFFKGGQLAVIVFPTWFVIKQLSKNYVCTRLFYFLCIILVMLATNTIVFVQSTVAYFSYLFKFLIFAFMLYYLKSNEIDFKKIVFWVITVLATYTLLLYVMINLIKIPLPHSICNLRDGSIQIYYNFYNLYYYRLDEYASFFMFGKQFDRLSGLFWEPGIYSIVLCYALYLFYYHLRSKNKYALFILLLNILFTFSTTGMCVALGIIGSYVVRNLDGYKRICVVPLLVIIVVCVSYIFFNKISSTASSNIKGLNAVSLRFLDIVLGLSLFIQHPLFGMGFQNFDVFENTMGLGRGCSNGLVGLLFTIGLVGGLFFFMPFFKNLRKRQGIEKYNYVVFFLMIFLLNMTEPIITSSFMTYILASEYADCFLIKRK